MSAKTTVINDAKSPALTPPWGDKCSKKIWVKVGWGKDKFITKFTGWLNLRWGYFALLTVTALN